MFLLFRLQLWSTAIVAMISCVLGLLVTFSGFSGFCLTGCGSPEEQAAAALIDGLVSVVLAVGFLIPALVITKQPKLAWSLHFLALIVAGIYASFYYYTPVKFISDENRQTQQDIIRFQLYNSNLLAVAGVTALLLLNAGLSYPRNQPVQSVPESLPIV